MKGAYTIKQQINQGKALTMTDKEMRIKALITLSEEDGTYILLNTKSILSKYRPIIKKYLTKYRFTGADEHRYEYRPTLLSYELYGTIELAPLILEVNGMISATEFTNLKNGVYLFDKNITDALNVIMIMEEKELNRNQTSVKEDLAKIY